MTQYRPTSTELEFQEFLLPDDSIGGYDGSGITSGSSTSTSDNEIVELGPPKGQDYPSDDTTNGGNSIDDQLGLNMGDIQHPFDPIVEEEFEEVTESNDIVDSIQNSVKNLTKSSNKTSFYNKLKDNSFIPLAAISVAFVYLAFKPKQ